MVPKQCLFRRPTFWHLACCATCLGSRDNCKYHTYIHMYIPTYPHDLSRISIDCLTPASRLRRSASVWITHMSLSLIEGRTNFTIKRGRDMGGARGDQRDFPKRPMTAPKTPHGPSQKFETRGAPIIFSRGRGQKILHSGQKGAKYQPYVSSLSWSRLPQSSYIAKNLKNRLQWYKSRNFTEKTLKIWCFSGLKGVSLPSPLWVRPCLRLWFALPKRCAALALCLWCCTDRVGFF